jgi:type I restriction enzyme S subunit
MINKYVLIKEAFIFLKKSKIKAGEGLDNGKYPFYTSSPQLSKYLNKYEIKEESLIFGTGGVASIHHSFGKFSTSTDCYVLQTNGKYEIDLRFVYLFLRGNINILENGFKGAGLKHISKKYIESIKIPLPPLQTQKRIVEILDKAQALIDRRREQIVLSDHLIQSMFYDMFGDLVANSRGWKVRNLTEFYLDGKNSIKCGPFGSALKKHEYTSQGIPVWVMDNISGSRFIDKPFLYISNNKYDQLKSYSVNNGDIIISRAGTVGKMCEIKTQYKNSIISTNLIRLRLNADLLPLFFVSLMTYCGPQICTLRTGNEGAFTHMNTGVLNNINFPYPPIDLQNKFAEIVQEIESQRQLMEESLVEMENNYNSLMQRAFKGELFS